MGKIHNLSTADKIELIDELWDSVIQDQNNVPITDKQRVELDKRLAAFEVDKDAGENWDIVRERISNK